MKLRLLTCITFIIALQIAAPARAQRITAESRIAAVTVYADRAQVTRTASVQLKPGTNLITFDSLPLLLAEDSLRVEGQGAGQARIAGLTVKNVFLERLQEAKIRELEGELAAVDEKLERIDARRKGLIAQSAFIQSIKVGWGERISKELSAPKPVIGELNDANKFVGDGITKIEEQIHRLKVEEKPLHERKTALLKQLQQARGERQKEVRSVEVAIEAAKAMPFNIQLSYVATYAGWEPTYDVRLAPDGKSAELTYRGTVWQKTGEDWPEVKLSLSTASPEVGGAPPELPPWHIGFYVPPRYEPRLGGAPKALMAPAPAVEAMAADMQRALPQSALLSEGQTSVLFNIVQPVTIPADGTRQATVIGIENLPVSAEYTTVPKLSPFVYLKSEVTNNTPYPLLSGPVNIFNDATFTGKEMLRTVATGEKFDLFFGADRQLKVKRDVIKTRKQGGILGHNRITYRVTVELENHKKRGVTVSLVDQLPLAGNEEIKVNLTEAEPRPTETKPDGTLVWKVSLAPGEKKRIPYEIVIEYPKGKELTGIE